MFKTFEKILTNIWPYYGTFLITTYLYKYSNYN